MQDHDEFLIDPEGSAIRFAVLGNEFADLCTTIKKARINIAQVSRLSSLSPQDDAGTLRACQSSLSLSVSQIHHLNLADEHCCDPRRCEAFSSQLLKPLTQMQHAWEVPRAARYLGAPSPDHYDMKAAF